ncbi:hypothetical protein CMV_029335 [Castanea mollissima]|uniref:Uncharacterized protein n=1 Tax=Castanea mollissima TaxID=60419 RepID=A0A8J4Q5D9_9ROSI|nr:hypothetical protein CMV_029335 [Castanea mollissima]
MPTIPTTPQTSNRGRAPSSDHPHATSTIQKSRGSHPAHGPSTTLVGNTPNLTGPKGFRLDVRQRTIPSFLQVILFQFKCLFSVFCIFATL